MKRITNESKPRKNFEFLPVRKFQQKVLRVDFFTILTFICSFSTQTMAQTSSPTNMSSPTVATTPSVVATPTNSKKKHDWFKQIEEGNALSQREAHEREIKELEELKKEGKWDKRKVFGVPSTVRKIPTPLPPPNFKIEPGNGVAYLSWDKAPSNWDRGVDGKSLGEMGYWIFISEDGVNFRKRMTAPIKTTKVTIGLLTNGKKYYFAIASVGEGGRSSEKTFQTVVPTERK